MHDRLPTLELETGKSPDAAVIWLHGLGADGSDFEAVVPELRLPAEAHVRFIFPHAPMMPVSCNGGYVMRAWYDIKELNPHSRHVDEAGVKRSCEAIRVLIARENERGIDSRRIVLAGFSQGGAIAYTAGLSHPDALAGIIALSTYLPAPALLLSTLSEVNRSVPIFAAHGDSDEVVSLQMGEAARDTLQGAGCTLAWHRYPMAHSVCLQELRDIGLWLGQRLLASPV